MWCLFLSSWFTAGSHSTFVYINRFKDYIPAKYHSLYEHYIEANDETLNNQSKEL